MSDIRKRETRRGETLRWLIANKGHADTSGCLIWPFSRSPDGRPHAKAIPCRIMCRLAHGEPPTLKHEAAHNCGNGEGGCINPHHLRWATHAENMADQRMHNTLCRGQNHWWAKLSDEQIAKIRSLKGTMPAQAIADRFGIARATVYRIHSAVAGYRSEVAL